MQTAEWYEEIRTLLNEAQVSTVAQPWTHTDVQLVGQIRSVLREMRAKGVLTTAVIDVDGNVAAEPADDEALCVAYRVAARLLRGDLLTKLAAGELGTLFQAGRDIIDTRNAADAFTAVATQYQKEADMLLILMLSKGGDVQSVFGTGAIQNQT